MCHNFFFFVFFKQAIKRWSLYSPYISPEARISHEARHIIRHNDAYCLHVCCFTHPLRKYAFDNEGSNSIALLASATAPVPKLKRH